MCEDITPEWDDAIKNAYVLCVQHWFESVDILPTDYMMGHNYDWCMGFIRERRPEVAVLTFGTPELCDMQHSIFSVASLDCMAALPVGHGIPCTPSLFRK